MSGGAEIPVAKRRTKRDKERHAAVAQGLDASEMMDDAFARAVADDWPSVIQCCSGVASDTQQSYRQMPPAIAHTACGSSAWMDGEKNVLRSDDGGVEPGG